MGGNFDGLQTTGNCRVDIYREHRHDDEQAWWE